MTLQGFMASEESKEWRRQRRLKYLIINTGTNHSYLEPPCIVIIA